MPRLLQAQQNATIKRLEKLKSLWIADTTEVIKEAIVPPLMTTEEVRQHLKALVYDKPEKALDMLMSNVSIPGGLPEHQKTQDARREGYLKLSEIVDSLEVEAQRILDDIELRIRFEDTWDITEYPVFLEDELIDSLNELVVTE